jgi:hypothetical protein
MSVIDDGGAARAASARLAGYGLAAAATGALFARYFYPGPTFTTALLLLSLGALAFAALAPELFEMTWRGGWRGMSPFIGAPSLFVFFVGLVTQVEDVVLPLAGAAAGAAALMLLSLKTRARPGLGNPLVMQAMVTVCGAALGYGAVVLADVDFDKSTPASLQVQVLDKYVTHGRSSTAYHLRLPPFANRTKPSSVTVSRRTYQALNPGDTACVLEHRGALGLKWIAARACDEH